LLAAAMLRLVAGDLGNAQLPDVGASLRAAPWSLLVFFLIGTLVACVGAWLPARQAAWQAPARALKGGDDTHVAVTQSASRGGIALLFVGAALAWLPPIKGLDLRLRRRGRAAVRCDLARARAHGTGLARHSSLRSRGLGHRGRAAA